MALVSQEAGRRRRIGLAVLAGLALKVVLERPWAGPLSYPQGWDIAVAPLAHAGGALAGAACALACGLRPRLRLRMGPRIKGP
jgi:hypothetical protein